MSWLATSNSYILFIRKGSDWRKCSSLADSLASIMQLFEIFMNFVHILQHIVTTKFFIDSMTAFLSLGFPKLICSSTSCNWILFLLMLNTNSTEASWGMYGGSVLISSPRKLHTLLASFVRWILALSNIILEIDVWLSHKSLRNLLSNNKKTQKCFVFVIPLFDIQSQWPLLINPKIIDVHPVHLVLNIARILQLGAMSNYALLIYCN